jgi:hypothetical protein
MRRSFSPLVLLAALAAASLASCSARVDIIIGAGSPLLRQELAKLATEYSRSKGLRLALVDEPTSRHGTAITIGWSFVPGTNSGKSFPLSVNAVRRSNYSTSVAFERWLRSEEGWREIPILWDAWGIAYSANTSASAGSGKIHAWKDRGTFLKPGKPILAPGGDSGVRQSLFWLSETEFPQAAMNGILLGGAERTGQGSLSHFKYFAALAKDPAFLPGSFGMLKPDAENLAKNARVDTLFGDYQWLRGLHGRGHRDFHAIVYSLPQGYAMPVSVLSGQVKGSGTSAAKAADFLAWILTPENQKELSDRTGYMAANFNAANLDRDALEARNAAIGAALAVPIDPEPAKGTAAESWDSLLNRVLDNPQEWERVVYEKESK